MARGRTIALGTLVAMSLAPAAADAAFVPVTVSATGTDEQTWSVAGGQRCARFGSGSQTVRFHTTRNASVLMGLQTVRHSSQLSFKVHGRLQGLSFPVRGTIDRTDGTQFSPADPEQIPCPVRPKDCRTKPLSESMSLLTQGRRFSAESIMYWDSDTGPWANCLGFSTPVGTGEDPPFWRGPDFGDILLTAGDNGLPKATGALVSPSSLRRGRTYRFAGGVRYGLTLPSAHFPRHLFQANGIQDPSPYDGIELVGAPTTVSERISWVVTVKRR